MLGRTGTSRNGANAICYPLEINHTAQAAPHAKPNAQMKTIKIKNQITTTFPFPKQEGALRSQTRSPRCRAIPRNPDSAEPSEKRRQKSGPSLWPAHRPHERHRSFAFITLQPYTITRPRAAIIFSTSSLDNRDKHISQCSSLCINSSDNVCIRLSIMVKCQSNRQILEIPATYGGAYQTPWPSATFIYKRHLNFQVYGIAQNKFDTRKDDR